MAVLFNQEKATGGLGSPTILATISGNTIADNTKKYVEVSLTGNIFDYDYIEVEFTGGTPFSGRSSAIFTKDMVEKAAIATGFNLAVGCSRGSGESNRLYYIRGIKPSADGTKVEISNCFYVAAPTTGSDSTVRDNAYGTNILIKTITGYK